MGRHRKLPLIEALTHEPDSPPLLVIAGYRRRELETNATLRALSAALEKGSDCRDLPLEELPSADARTLAIAIAGAGDPELPGHVAQARATSLTQAAIEVAGGNPFLIDSMLRRGSVAQQMAALPESARELVELLSVAARPLPRPMLGTIPGAALDPATVNLLRVERLVRTRSTGGAEELEIYHDRIREPVAAGLSPQRLKKFNLSLAQAWSNVGETEAESAALHFLAAEDIVSAARFAAIAAAQAAAALAFDRAARLYRLALRSPAGPDEERRLTIELARSLIFAGRKLESADVWLGAAESASGEQRLECLRYAAEQFLMGGDFDRGISVLTTVLSSAGLRLAPSRRAALFSFLRRRLWLAIRGTRFRVRDTGTIAPA